MVGIFKGEKNGRRGNKKGFEQQCGHSRKK